MVNEFRAFFVAFHSFSDGLLDRVDALGTCPGDVPVSGMVGRPVYPVRYYGPEGFILVRCFFVALQHVWFSVPVVTF